jgi:sigma-E factor negative regulatory protein RseA
MPNGSFSNEESLSALMDGAATELELHRLLGECANQPALRQQWLRYQLVSAALHQQPIATKTSLQFADAVRQAIEEGGVMPKQSSRWQVNGRIFSRVAIAASVALVVVVGAQWHQQSSSTAVLVTTAAPAASSPLLSSTTEMSEHLASAPAAAALHVDSIFAQSRDQRNAFFTPPKTFENASMNARSVRVPLIRASEHAFPQ